MHRYCWILFFCSIIFNDSSLFAQIKIRAGVEVLPATFISSELFYREYFGKDKEQFNFYGMGSIGVEINEKWVLISGVGFQKRQMETDCLFVPSGPISIIPVSSYMPKTSIGICTHLAKGRYSIIDIPLRIGYKFGIAKKIRPYCMVGFSPFKWIRYSETRTNIDTGEVQVFDRQSKSERYYLFFGNVSIGSEFKLSPNFNLLCAFTYKVDDKSYKDKTIGLSIGANYLWGI